MYARIYGSTESTRTPSMDDARVQDSGQSFDKIRGV
jgi:hypothetical protein